MAKQSKKEGAPENIPVPPLFLTNVARMRFFQSQFFRTKDKSALQQSIKFEKLVDADLENIATGAVVAAAAAALFPDSEVSEITVTKPPPPPPPPPTRPAPRVSVIKLSIVIVSALFFFSCGNSERYRYVCNCQANQKIEKFVNNSLKNANNMSDEEMEDVIFELYKTAVKIHCRARFVVYDSDGKVLNGQLNTDSCEHIPVVYL